MSEQAAMTVEQAIEFAREWQKGLTVYPGAMGWRVVCMVLADEAERLQARVAELESQAQAVEDSEICAGAELMMVHDRFMRGVLTKEIMVDAVNRAGKKSIARIKAEAIRAAAEEYEREYCGQGVVALLLDYANQIEGGA